MEAEFSEEGPDNMGWADQDWDYRPRFQPDCVSSVLVTHVYGIGLFYGLVLDNPKIQDDVIKLESSLVEMEHVPLKVRPLPSKIYAAIFHEDGCTYRCMLLGLLPNGKHKIVFIDFGNTAEVDEILELPEPLVSIPCHLERFFMKGVKLVESDKIDNEIDRKLFQWFKQRLNSQEVIVITRSTPELGVTVKLDDRNINVELKKESKRIYLSLGNPPAANNLVSCNFDAYEAIESIYNRLTEARKKADKLLEQAEETLAIADRVSEVVDAVNSNPPNFETDLDSIEAVDELIVKLDKVLCNLSNIGKAQAEEARTSLVKCRKEKTNAEMLKIESRNSVDKLNRLKVLKAEWLAVKARHAPLPPFTPEDLVGIDLANHLEEVRENLVDTLNSWKAERKSFVAKSRQTLKMCLSFYIERFTWFLANISAEGCTDVSSLDDEDLENRLSHMEIAPGRLTYLTPDDPRGNMDAFKKVKLAVESEEQMLAMEELLELESFMSLAVTESIARVEAQLEPEAVAVNRFNLFVQRIASN